MWRLHRDLRLGPGQRRHLQRRGGRDAPGDLQHEREHSCHPPAGRRRVRRPIHSRDVGFGEIDNSKPPTVSISSDARVTEGNAGTESSARFTVTLSSPSQSVVTVDLSTSDGTAMAGLDYTSNSGTLTFAPGNTTKNITVIVNGDLTDESDEVFTVNLNNAMNASVSDGQGVATIIDNDGAGRNTDTILDRVGRLEAKLDLNLDAKVSSRATQASVDAIDQAVARLEGKADRLEGKADVIELKLDTNLDAKVSSRASQGSVDTLLAAVNVLEGKADVMEAKLDGKLDACVSTRASQASLDSLRTSVDSFFDIFTELSTLPPGTTYPQFVVDSFFDVFVELDALDGRIGNLNPADLDKDGRLDVALSSRASQGSVDALQASVDSFFDIFTEVSVRQDAAHLSLQSDLARETSELDAAIDSFLDVFTEVNLRQDLALAGLADSFFDVFVELDTTQSQVDTQTAEIDTAVARLEGKADWLEGKADVIERKLDTSLDAKVSNRASQASVDILETKADDLPFEVKDLDADMPEGFRADIFQIRADERYLIQTTLDGAPITVTLFRVVAYRSTGTGPMTATTLPPSSVTSVGIGSNGVMDVTVIPPTGGSLGRVRLYQFLLNYVDLDGVIRSVAAYQP
ncbi:MAG: hypothetical protein FJ312_05505 [SAR202 cluster bacterium]|nr:hypothetical protein [SAR202 cluster bacterium]